MLCRILSGHLGVVTDVIVEHLGQSKIGKKYQKSLSYF